MESIGWDAERVELKAELSRLEEELAESRAETEELRSRSNVLTERLSQTLDPSMSLHWGNEQRDWRKKLREGRERETRQALLLQKLQQKVTEYRSRCELLQHHIMTEKREMNVRERILRDERSDNLETTLIRLEEEQQRSVTLTEVNALLRSQLSQSAEANQALQDDLRKLTADWSKAVEEAEQKELDWNKEKEVLSGYLEAERSRFMSLWSKVVALKRQCHAVKLATDKDLWELRAEFTRLSSTFLSLNVLPALSTHSRPPPPPPPPPALYTCGPMTLSELDHDAKTEKLKSRIDELNAIVKSQELDRQKQEEAMKNSIKIEERERELQQEKYREKERQLESIAQAIRKLCGLLGPPKRMFPDSGVFNDDLNSVLWAVSEVEDAFQCGHKELQEAEGKCRRLRMETESLQQQIAELENEKAELQKKANLEALELKQTHSLLNSEKETALSLKKQLDESEHRSEELKKENVRLIQQREREDEERSEIETERQRRVAEELVENAHLCEQQNRTRIELHALQVALEQERQEKTHAEKDLADTRDALAKARESLLSLSSTHNLLQRQSADTRDSLEKMATLNESLARDKRELSARNVQLEEEVTACQLQLQCFRSDVASLQKELDVALEENTELRALRNADLDSLYQLSEREKGIEEELQILKEESETESNALTDEKRKNEELSEQYRSLCVELRVVKEKLDEESEQSCRAQKEHEELQREKHRLEEQVRRMWQETEDIKHDLEDLRNLNGNLQQQLCGAKEQTSVLEVQDTQLKMQVHTLQQAKDVLHGEIKCLQSELERNSFLREEERKGVIKEQLQHGKEINNWQLEIRRLNDEARTSINNLKIHEEDREKWQREREALNSELGLKDGEMRALTHRMDGLVKENDKLAVLIGQKDRTVEGLFSEIRSLKLQMKEAKAEVEQWRERVTGIEREKEGLLKRVTQDTENLTMIEKKNAEMADILKMRDDEIEKKRKRVEGLTENLELQDILMEKLKRELNEKDIEIAAAINDEKIKRTQREAEEKEKELKLKEELKKKENELRRIKDNLEELKMEIQHMSLLMQEKDTSLEQLKDKVVDLKQTDKETQDKIKWWKTKAEDLEREKELLTERVENHISVKQDRDELAARLTERDKEIQTLKKNEHNLGIDIERRKEEQKEQEKELKRRNGEVEEHQSTIAKLTKEKSEREEWKMQLEELKKEKASLEEKKNQLEEEERNMKEEITVLRGKMDEQDREKEQLQRQVLEEREQLQIHSVFLKDRERDVNGLRKTLEQKEQQENERIETLKETLKEIQLDRENDRDIQREYDQKLQLTRETLEHVEGKVKELEIKNKNLTQETDLLREKHVEQLAELETKSKLLQEYEENVRRLKLRVESREEEKEQLKKSLKELIELRERKEEEETLGILLKHQIRGLEENLRVKDEVMDALKEKTDLILKEKEEEIKHAKQNKDTVLAEVTKLKEEVTVLSVSKKKAETIGKEQGRENKKMIDGLKAGLEEMVKLKEMLEESHCEGEKLRKILEEKKNELIKGRNEVRSARDKMEHLKHNVQILQKENQELHAQLWIRKENGIKMNCKVGDEKKMELDVHETLKMTPEEKTKDKNNPEDTKRLGQLKDNSLELISKKIKEEESEMNKKKNTVEERERELQIAEFAQVKTTKEKRILEEKSYFQFKEGFTIVNAPIKKDSQCQTERADNTVLQAEVYDLKKEADELRKDRDRLRTALEKNESMLIHYREKAHELEKKLQLAISREDESQERVRAMQRAVAELELKLLKLQRRNERLERRVDKLRLDKTNLRDTLKQVELEREKLRCQLLQPAAESQDHSNPSEAEELKCLRLRTSELSAQVHQLRLLLASDHQERADFIERSLVNSSLMQTLRQDLNDSLTLVSKQLAPSVLDCETQRLGRSIRTEQFRSLLSRS